MNLEIIILAAGQGSRMKSQLPKVLHPVAGRPLLQHVMDTALSLEPVRLHVVVGHGAEQVRELFVDYDVNWVTQNERLGTGHAVLQVLPDVAADSTVLILYGDVPLIEAATLRELVSKASQAPALLTAQVANPAGYGRIIRDEAGTLLAVVEHKDADPQQRQISEINSGIMAAPAVSLNELLPQVGNANSQGEYYLPDILGLAVNTGTTVESCGANSEIEILGVNDRLQLNLIERQFQHQVAQQLMLQGVSLADPRSLQVRGELSCGEDVTIDVNVVIEGQVQLGSRVVIEPNCVLRDVVIGDGVTVHAMSHLDGCEVGNNCNVGPFGRLRPGTVLRDGARVGNFVEVKKSVIGVGSKVNHLSYIGDCTMGAGVNIGAGTITCNYDGVDKFNTEIGDDCFVGSNSTLVAPLTIGNNGFVAAGSTITKAVVEGQLAVGRARQKNIAGWKRPEKDNDQGI